MGEAKRRGTFEQRRSQAMANQVTPNDLTDFNCDCGNNLFFEIKQIKKLSSMSPKNPTGKDQLIIFPIFKCTSCNSCKVRPFRNLLGSLLMELRRELILGEKQ